MEAARSRFRRGTYLWKVYKEAKMAKSSARPRTVDVNKRMPVYGAEEIPDLPECAEKSRVGVRVSTGMEKEEEQELHLQRAISAQRPLTSGAVGDTDSAVIPIPKVSSDLEYYDRLYPPNYQAPKQMITVQTLDCMPETPEYDLDSDDEQWLASAAGASVEMTPSQFERIMDALEKRSDKRVVQPSEVPSLLAEDESLLLAVYDYWLDKRRKAKGMHLVAKLKPEWKENTDAEDPYVAFRRRHDKMQTRKDRKNDEQSYLNLFRLREGMQKALCLAEMVKERESTKRSLVKTTVDIFEKRCLLNAFDDQSIELSALDQLDPSDQIEKAVTSSFAQWQSSSTSHSARSRDERFFEEEIRSCKFAEERKVHRTTAVMAETKEARKESDAFGHCSFVRRHGCKYYAPSRRPEAKHSQSSSFKPTCLRSSPRSELDSRFVVLARRRVGRGGRILLDRISTPERATGFLTDQDGNKTEIDGCYRPLAFDDEATSDGADLLSDNGPSSLVLGPNGGVLFASFSMGALEEEAENSEENESNIAKWSSSEGGDSSAAMLDRRSNDSPLDTPTGSQESAESDRNRSRRNFDDSGSTIILDSAPDAGHSRFACLLLPVSPSRGDQCQSPMTPSSSTRSVQFPPNAEVAALSKRKMKKIAPKRDESTIGQTGYRTFTLSRLGRLEPVERLCVAHKGSGLADDKTSTTVRLGPVSTPAMPESVRGCTRDWRRYPMASGSFGDPIGRRGRMNKLPMLVVPQLAYSLPTPSPSPSSCESVGSKMYSHASWLPRSTVDQLHDQRNNDQ